MGRKQTTSRTEQRSPLESVFSIGSNRVFRNEPFALPAPKIAYLSPRCSNYDGANPTGPLSSNLQPDHGIAMLYSDALVTSATLVVTGALLVVTKKLVVTRALLLGTSSCTQQVTSPGSKHLPHRNRQ